MSDEPKTATPIEFVERIKPWKVILGSALALIIGTGSALAYLDRYAKKEWLSKHIAASSTVHETLQEKASSLAERQAATEAHHADFKEDLTEIKHKVSSVESKVNDIYWLLEHRRR